MDTYSQDNILIIIGPSMFWSFGLAAIFVGMLYNDQINSED